MVKHYLKVTFRHIRKHLLISILNIGGLAIGIACFVLIMLYVNHELNYDRFNEHYNDIYRIGVDAKIGNTVIKQLGTPAPMPAAMYDEFPEIRAITRLYGRPYTIRIGERFFNETNAVAVDSTFSEIFTLNFIEGSPENALNAPGQVLINQSTAQKYFGDQPALGKVLMITDDTTEVTITGVFEDFPAQSHFHFNLLVSLLTIDGQYNNEGWFSNNFATYMRLESGFPYGDLEAKFPDFVNKYLFGDTYEDFADEENFWHLYLQTLKDIHLGSDLSGEIEPNGNLSYIKIFSVVAFLVLIVACINFMSLTTASASIRSREVGVRKTNGASQKNLRRQFFSEAIIISILAMIIGMGVVESLMGVYKGFVGREIELHYLDNFLVIPGLMALSIIVGLFSGSYPAFYMANFSATDSLGYKGIKISRSWFRNILVLFQFSVAIFLLASTFLVRSQMKLITEEALGFDKEQVVLVRNAHYLDSRMESMQQEFLQRTEISDVSTSFFVPGDNLINWGFGAQDFDNAFSLNVNLVNEDYQSTMRLRMKEGRFFSRDFGADTFGIVLNETAVELLEYDDPIGKTLYLWNDRNRPFTVIGVVEDYFYESKHQRIRPHAIMNLTSMDWAPEAYLAVRIKDDDPKAIVKFIEERWNEAITEIPFEFAFLDTHYEGIYHNEKQTQAILYLFAGIAIFISCLGLFGLASFMAERRTKEIGIRKTNGAETSNILMLLSIDFTKWVLIANIIAWPLTWLAMRRWLHGFAYQTEIKFWMFIIAGVIAFLIALLTVLFHAIKASRQNPVKSLRYE